MEQSFYIALILGSIREKRQGIKVARWLETQVKARGHQVDFMDLQAQPVPLLVERYKDYAAGEAPEVLEKYHQRLLDADGFVLVTPEYNHGTSGVLKNFLDTFQPEFFQKPVAIAAYSNGGFGGLRGVMTLLPSLIELRMTPTPTNFAVSNVETTFAEPGQPVDEEREKYEKAAERFLAEFEWYLEALKVQREKRGSPYP